MPRVLVTTDDPSRQVVLDELVESVHLDSEHSAVQLTERIAWGLDDAERRERAFRDAVKPTPHTQVNGTRSKRRQPALR